MSEGWKYFEFDLEEFIGDDKIELFEPKQVIEETWPKLKSLTFKVNIRPDLGGQELVEGIRSYIDSLWMSIDCVKTRNTKLRQLSFLFNSDVKKKNPFTQHNWQGITSMFPTFQFVHSLILDMRPFYYLKTFGSVTVYEDVLENLPYLSHFTYFYETCSYITSVYFPHKFIKKSSLTKIAHGRVVPRDKIDICRLIKSSKGENLSISTKTLAPETALVLRRNKHLRKFFAEILCILYVGVKKRLGLLRYINKDCVTVLLQFLKPSDLVYKEKEEKDCDLVIEQYNQCQNKKRQITANSKEIERLEQEIVNMKKRKGELNEGMIGLEIEKKQALAKLDKIIKDGRGA